MVRPMLSLTVVDRVLCSVKCSVVRAVRSCAAIARVARTQVTSHQIPATTNPTSAQLASTLAAQKQILAKNETSRGYSTLIPPPLRTTDLPSLGMVESLFSSCRTWLPVQAVSRLWTTGRERQGISAGGLARHRLPPAEPRRNPCFGPRTAGYRANMTDPRPIGILLLVAGAVGTAVSALADPLGIGEGNVFGWLQITGVVIGAVVTLLGLAIATEWVPIPGRTDRGTAASQNTTLLSDSTRRHRPTP